MSRTLKDAAGRVARRVASGVTSRQPGPVKRRGAGCVARRSRLGLATAVVAGGAAVWLLAWVPPAAGQQREGEGPRSHPEPRLVSDAWQLEFAWEKPRPIARRDADGGYQWFWYLPYKVTNNTGRSVMFIPEVTIATDTGRIMPAGQDIPAGVYRLIEAELRNPLLESPIEVVGELLEGEDYARESVAIWPAFEENVTEMTVFFAGLSGETASIRNPLTGENVMMRRTHMLQFHLPGNPRSPQRQDVVLEASREVMR